MIYTRTHTQTLLEQIAERPSESYTHAPETMERNDLRVDYF